MVVATVIQSVWQIPGVATIGSAFGGIPLGLPDFSIPTVTAPQLIQLIGPAFHHCDAGRHRVVAFSGGGRRHDRHQTRLEPGRLVGQGLANIVTPLFGGFAATGAIARTATNVRNGGTSPLAGITHTLTLVAVILFLAPLAQDIPLASLAAILFVVAYNMSEIPHFLHILLRAPRADGLILVITFLLTVFCRSGGGGERGA